MIAVKPTGARQMPNTRETKIRFNVTKSQDDGAPSIEGIEWTVTGTTDQFMAVAKRALAVMIQNKVRNKWNAKEDSQRPAASGTTTIEELTSPALDPAKVKARTAKDQARMVKVMTKAEKEAFVAKLTAEIEAEALDA